MSGPDYTADEVKHIVAGDRAKAILEDESFLAAVEKTRESYMHSWLAAPTVQERENMHARVSALDDVLGNLRSIMETGTFMKAKASRRAKR